MNKVSIIIPAYNVEEYIEETLQSFLNQTLKDIEIIIVEDGSTDSTCKILEKYRQMDHRISILHQENKGAGIARNFGMANATGEYLYFFDGDDYCIPAFLQSVVTKADETQADIVVFDYYRVDNVTKKEFLYRGLKRSLLPKNKDYFNYKDLPDRILSIVNPTPWNKLYRRSYVQKTNLQYMGLSTTNDITFASLSVAMAQKIVYLGKPFMYYRINRTAAITSFKQKKLSNVIAAIEGVIEQARIIPYYKEEAVLSLMVQTVKADKIVLWLAKDNFPHGESELPEGLLQLKRKGLEIKWCDVDYRSYKKILPSLKEFPEDIILTADDDLIYPPTMIEQLYDSYKKYPTSISAVRTHQMTFEENGSIKPYCEWKKEDSEYIGMPRMDLFPTTGAGTLFPPHCLPEITTDWNAIMENCPNADDIWIKVMSLVNHVPVVLTAEQKRLRYIPGTQEDRLWNINRVENDKQLNNVLKKYNVYFDEKSN